ncbi:MAG: DNA polymerase III subunit gamma/tau [Anaerolineales bacterium]|nr:DNA polymerase III subunit gamma/tau [Anaerolineales bacterium]
MSLALYRKWRPQKWDEVVGQQHVIQTLRNAVAGGRVAHAYLFSGPRGTGKTTVARLLAKAVNCLQEDLAARPCDACAHCRAVGEARFLDLIEIDAASQTGVDDVRDLRDKINFSPNQGRYKVYIIDEVHMFSTSAFNALLKTLEEPPPHAIFVLATTEIHKIPATVLSRCQRHEFRRVPVDEIVVRLQTIVENEKLSAEPEALTLIARQATGSLRDAISLLDQLASTGQEITLGLAQAVLGTATSQMVLELVAAVLERDPAAGMDAIHRALDGGTDARTLARQVVDYLRALLLVQMGNAAQVDLAAEARLQAEQHAQAFSTAEVLRIIKAFNAAASEQRSGWQPSLPLELALAEMMEVSGTRPAVSAPPRKAVDAAGPGSKAAPKKAAEPVGEAVGREEAPKPSVDGPDSQVSLEQVTQAWKQIRALIKPQNPALDGLLNSCKLLDVKDGILVLGFASEVVRSKADKPEQLEAARQAITEVLGADVPVRCVVSNARQNTPLDVKVDGMVAAALKAGGEIVDIQD